MKIIDRLLVIIFNLCLLLAAGITPALILASSPSYYYKQFEKNEIYSYTDENGEEKRKIIRYVGGEINNLAMLSDEQLNTVIEHITDYLFTDKESFELKMDGVYIIDKGLCDGVNIFGERAVSHMADVKSLMTFAKWAAIVSFIIVIVLLTVFIKKKQTRKFLLKYTAVFYGIICGLAALFCIGSFIDALVLTGGNTAAFSYFLWKNMHYLLFPFQPDKVENSVLSDTLTQILTLELFMSAVAVVVATIIFVLIAWLISAYVLQKRAQT